MTLVTSGAKIAGFREVRSCRCRHRSSTNAPPAWTKRSACWIGWAARRGSIAGGHSLLPMMKLRLANPEYLIDINDLHAELGYIRVEPRTQVRIGAMTRHRELLESDELAAAFPIFRDAERVIADPVVRNRGTLGGSLCQADPSEDLSAVCTTLDARCVVRGPRRRAGRPMDEFHRGPYETALGDNEMLIEVRIPVRPSGRSAYAKVERRVGDWAVVAAGAAVWLDGGAIADARVGLAAVGPEHDRASRRSRTRCAGRRPSEERLRRRPAAIAARSLRPGRPTCAAAPSTSATWPTELTIRTLRARPCASTERGAETMQVTMTVNGEQVTAEVEPRMLLVHFLRDQLG